MYQIVNQYECGTDVQEPLDMNVTNNLHVDTKRAPGQRQVMAKAYSIK